MNALVRARGAAGWAFATWIFFVALSKIAALLVGNAAAQAAQPFSGPLSAKEDLFAVAQLAYLHPGLLATSVLAPIVMAGLGILGWTIVCGLVLVRLQGPTTPLEAGRRWLQTLPGLLVQSGWHLLLRGAALGIVVLSLGPVDPVALGIAACSTWWLATLALDLTRVDVVLGGGRPWHPRGAALAFVHAVARPRLCLVTIALQMAQMGCAAVIVWFAVAAVGPSSSSWVGLATAAVAVALGVLRLAVVVEHRAVSATGAVPAPD